ncbi:unnamed protein product [Penicillium olsonii]|uniref:Uncharacterized protein n=1 Tax=Penicillium olsonii TaxID=99116 RepID=A0A9W4IKK9_PENOL|nr:unnamed protein product [Penicillium olsonii]CAG8302978.1 unnamed protein product [Penicillium olsonii]
MTGHEDCDELDDLGRGFLQSLHPVIETYTVDSESQFLNIVTSKSQADDTPSNVLLFHTSEEIIHNILDFKNSFWKYLSAVDLNGKLILTKMPTIPHGTLGGELDNIICEVLRPMGLNRALKTYPETRVHGDGERRYKFPDFGWGPKRRPRDQPDEPSVVLETAYTENDIKLQPDIRFWLTPDNGNANVCLTAKIDKENSEIRLEQWHRFHGRIRRKQVISITIDSNNELAVSGDNPLNISFSDLFRREPSRPGETSVSIPDNELTELARTVWDNYDI